MPKQAKPDRSLRNLPSVDELVRDPLGVTIANVAGERHAVALVRSIVAELRKAMPAGSTKESLLELALQRLAFKWNEEQNAETRRVINATGVAIHTNLGRAPLSEAAIKAVADASRYCTLEYDIATGKRGRRGRRAEDLIVELTGAEDALIVNNCAAAAFFVLTVFAAGGEVLLSRGEMVEIGGDFRVPDVLAQSGAVLREVGTTNRTRLTDYERAVSDKSRVVLRVHPSNYRIVGFTATPALNELSSLAKKHRLLLYEDAGSGALSDLSNISMVDEPVVSRSIRDGAHIVTFSGDKLLGGPQAGIIAGKRRLIDQLRKHPLYRALRVSKLTYAALEATLESHRRGTASSDVPVLSMLSAKRASIAKRVDRFIEKFEKQAAKKSYLTLKKIDGISAVGGGAAPAIELETVLIALHHSQWSAKEIESRLRRATPPVVARIANGRVLIDLRTVSAKEEKDVISAFLSIDATR